ncbi:MAG TPA: hypothetical protein VFX38_08205 [Gammaproteobacteria bacterium]|nr:hypothetical protein [Gammaproteobacteria bacterium]
MSKRSSLERLLRRGLLVLLIALAAAAVYLWVYRGSGEAQAFDRIYEASVAQASGNLRLEAALGVPIQASEQAASHKFYREDQRHHVRFHYPLSGPRGTVSIEGEAIQLGRNWLIVALQARFPNDATLDLTSNVAT